MLCDSSVYCLLQHGLSIKILEGKSITLTLDYNVLGLYGTPLANSLKNRSPFLILEISLVVYGVCLEYFPTHNHKNTLFKLVF